MKTCPFFSSPWFCNVTNQCASIVATGGALCFAAKFVFAPGQQHLLHLPFLLLPFASSFLFLFLLLLLGDFSPPFLAFFCLAICFDGHPKNAPRKHGQWATKTNRALQFVWGFPCVMSVLYFVVEWRHVFLVVRLLLLLLLLLLKLFPSSLSASSSLLLSSRAVWSLLPFDQMRSCHLPLVHFPLDSRTQTRPPPSAQLILLQPPSLNTHTHSLKPAYHHGPYSRL